MLLSSAISQTRVFNRTERQKELSWIRQSLLTQNQKRKWKTHTQEPECRSNIQEGMKKPFCPGILERKTLHAGTVRIICHSGKTQHNFPDSIARSIVAAQKRFFREEALFRLPACTGQTGMYQDPGTA